MMLWSTGDLLLHIAIEQCDALASPMPPNPPNATNVHKKSAPPGDSSSGGDIESELPPALNRAVVHDIGRSRSKTERRICHHF